MNPGDDLQIDRLLAVLEAPYKEMQRCFAEVTAELVAIKVLLVAKGIMTEKELDRTKAQAVQQLDQAVMERDEEADKENEL